MNPPPPMLGHAALLSRARRTLENKSDSYIKDARLFAKVMLLLEPLLAEGAIDLAVEDEP